MKKYMSLLLATVVFLTSIFAVSASAQAATLTLNSVRAVAVSSGISFPLTTAVKDVVKGTKNTQVGAVGGAFLGPKGSAAVTKALATLGSAINTVTQKIPDELYIKSTGGKVWPAGKYQIIKSGETIPLNVTTNFNDEAQVVLWEYDIIGSDDLLGQQTFKPDSESGEYMLYSAEEGSVYFLNVSVTP